MRKLLDNRSSPCPVCFPKSVDFAQSVENIFLVKVAQLYLGDVIGLNFVDSRNRS